MGKLGSNRTHPASGGYLGRPWVRPGRSKRRFSSAAVLESNHLGSYPAFSGIWRARSHPLAEVLVAFQGNGGAAWPEAWVGL